jgi:hypothetical protein
MNNSRLNLPNRPFRSRAGCRARNNFSGQAPLGLSGMQPLHPSAKNVWPSESQWGDEGDVRNGHENKMFKRTFALACLLYPCLETDVVRSVLVEHNLVLDDSSLESLSQRCHFIHKNHVHGFHLDQLEINSYKTCPCEKEIGCLDYFCQNYHFLGERRRVPVLYSPVLCSQIMACPKGDSDFNPDEKPDISLLDEASLERLKQIKLNEKTELINNLENRFLWLRTLKSKYFCCSCKSSPSVCITVPCGHLYCDNCKSGNFCEVCRISCSFYKLDRR